ncbi:protein sax-3-like [Stylophora pistillata]|uniref:protein sax-3-like n=1 Tax=Stylophora pistillata TaxID=50429 RepID=UPI000C03A985|nr:protein sax-3-like [Stylophora pistillata]
MCSTHWLWRDISNFIMLLLVTSAPSDLSSAKMRKGCNNKIVIPEIDISTSPPNRTLTIGAAISLTCIARPRNGDRLFPRRQTKYIQWYDPQGKPVGARCLQGTPAVRKLSCRLMLQRVTLEQFGNYTCEAENDYVGYCRQSTVEIKLRAFLAPQIVEDPKNQTVDAGFNITFNCTAKGHPMPSLKWIKNDNSLAVRSNPRINVSQTFLDNVQIHSQLIIEDLKREDNGKYHCLANNSEGEKASNPAFLSTKDLDDKARIVEDPVNQTAFVGFNVTFNCSAAGLLEQTITWVKNNNSHAVNSNPRVKVIRIPLDGEGVQQSQLSIKEVKEEDKGKYICVAKSSAGEITSKSAFLFIKHLAYPTTVSPRKERQHSVLQIIVLSVFGGTLITFMCGCTMKFSYRRARRNEERTYINMTEDEISGRFEVK